MSIKINGNSQEVYFNGINTSGFLNGDMIWGDLTDIVPLAAVYSGSNYYYCKNFSTPTARGTTTWTANFQNMNVADYQNLSFQLGGDLDMPIIGGVYGYESKTRVVIDYVRPGGETRPYSMGVVMFGPRSYYTGNTANMPHIVAMVANTQNNAIQSANLQIGGHIEYDNDVHKRFVFDTPLTSNLYGVYGFCSNTDSGSLYGGAIVRSYRQYTSGFTFNSFAANNSSNEFVNGNYQFVVVQ